jgi:hypothetical protein
MKGFQVFTLFVTLHKNSNRWCEKETTVQGRLRDNKKPERQQQNHDGQYDHFSKLISFFFVSVFKITSLAMLNGFIINLNSYLLPKCPMALSST